MRGSLRQPVDLPGGAATKVAFTHAATRRSVVEIQEFEPGRVMRAGEAGPMDGIRAARDICAPGLRPPGGIEQARDAGLVPVRRHADPRGADGCPSERLHRAPPPPHRSQRAHAQTEPGKHEGRRPDRRTSRPRPLDVESRKCGFRQRVGHDRRVAGAERRMTTISGDARTRILAPRFGGGRNGMAIRSGRRRSTAMALTAPAPMTGGRTARHQATASMAGIASNPVNDGGPETSRPWEPARHEAAARWPGRHRPPAPVPAVAEPAGSAHGRDGT